MPSLHNLPTELLFIIARFLGGAYLQARVDRRLICKNWYEVTQVVAFEHILLHTQQRNCALHKPGSLQIVGSQDWMNYAEGGFTRVLTKFSEPTLQRFLNSSDHGQSDYAHHERVYTNVRTLRIEGRERYSLRNGSHNTTSTLWSIPQKENWGSFISFATHLKYMVHLKELSLRFYTDEPYRVHRPLPSATRHMQAPPVLDNGRRWDIGKWSEDQSEKVWYSSIVSLAPSFPKSLISLTIDNPSPGPSGLSLYNSVRIHSCFSENEEKLQPHTCALLLSKDCLPNLRHLRYRARTVCPEFFRLSQASFNDRLETLVVNLTSDVMKTHPTNKCDDNHRTILPYDSSIRWFPGSPEFAIDMKEAARAATHKYPSIKMLRIIYDEIIFGTHQVVLYDAIANTSYALLDNVHWYGADPSDWSEDSKRAQRKMLQKRDDQEWRSRERVQTAADMVTVQEEEVTERNQASSSHTTRNKLRRVFGRSSHRP